MAGSKLGYYTRDTGDGNVYYYFMGDEPPLEQYRLNGKIWVPLVDGWSVMDMLMNAQPDLDGPPW
jgi:hypothetical protein